MTKICHLVALLCALSCQGVFAEQLASSIDIHLRACEDKNPSTAGTIGCIHEAQELWDKALNLTYKEIRLRLNSDETEVLKKAQLAWLKLRDLEYQVIDAIYAKYEGTMYASMREYRKMKIIKARGIELQEYLDLLVNLHK